MLSRNTQCYAKIQWHPIVFCYGGHFNTRKTTSWSATPVTTLYAGWYPWLLERPQIRLPSRSPIDKRFIDCNPVIMTVWMDYITALLILVSTLFFLPDHWVGWSDRMPLTGTGGLPTDETATREMEACSRLRFRVWKCECQCEGEDKAIRFVVMNT